MFPSIIIVNIINMVMFNISIISGMIRISSSICSMRINMCIQCQNSPSSMCMCSIISSRSIMCMIIISNISSLIRIILRIMILNIIRIGISIIVVAYYYYVQSAYIQYCYYYCYLLVQYWY